LSSLNWWRATRFGRAGTAINLLNFAEARQDAGFEARWNRRAREMCGALRIALFEADLLPGMPSVWRALSEFGLRMASRCGSLFRSSP